MKKLIYTLLSTVAFSVFLTSCKMTVISSSRDQVSMPPLKVKRTDYKLTDDVTAEAEVSVIRFLIFTKVKGVDRKNIKEGQILGGGAATTADEKLAVYNLIEKNADFDYITNVRFEKTYTKKLFKTTYKTKVIAKGIILNTDK